MTTINASEDQIKKILKKHLFWVFLIGYKYDDEDDIGFISCYNIFGAWIQFQWRDGVPMFFELQSSGIRYDIGYPKDKMLKRLTEIGKIAEKRFWKGGQL